MRRIIPLKRGSLSFFLAKFLLLNLVANSGSEIQIYRYVDETDNLISNEDYYASLSSSRFPSPPTTFRPEILPFRPSAVSAPPQKRPTYPHPVYIRPQQEFQPSSPSTTSESFEKVRRPNPHYIQTAVSQTTPSISSTTPTTTERVVQISSSTTTRAPTSTRLPTSTPSYLDSEVPLGMGTTTPTPPSAEVFLTKGNTEETETIALGMSSLSSSSGGRVSDILITPAMVRNGSQFNHVVLLCNASYPVEWIYLGVGAPMLYTTQIRTFGNFWDPSTYGHSIIVVLVQDRLDERQTGSYVCRGIDQPQLRTGFHLFFKGEFGFPALQNVVIQPESEASNVLLPCPTTDPSATIGLYKVADAAGESRNLTFRGQGSESFGYNPRKGFSLNLASVSNPFGTYICKFNGQDTDWKIQVVPPKFAEVEVIPEGTVIHLDNLTDHSFTCRAKEPIQIMLPNTVDFGRVEYSQQFGTEFPYLARLTVTPSIPLFSVANYFKINCQSRATRRVLHSWEYSNFGSEAISVSYDKHHKRLLCCTKSGLTPRHEMAKCETVTDCRIKQHCFSSGRCDYAYPPQFVDAPRGCTAIEFMDDFPSHVMKCSVGGGQFSKMVMVTSNIANDNLIIYDGSVPETEEILKIVQMKPKRNRRGRGQIRIRCVANIFYFSTNIVFAFQKSDGSLEFADEGDVDNVNSYGPTLKTTPPLDTESVICFAPLTRSSQWRNASVDISNPEEEYEGGRFSFPAVAKGRGRLIQGLLLDTDHGTFNSEEEEDKERVTTSVKASTSVTTFLRKKQGHLIRVMQDS